MAAPIVHLRDIQTRPRIFTIWEKQRNKKEVHWFMEMFAETLGVFFYVYAGKLLIFLCTQAVMLTTLQVSVQLRVLLSQCTAYPEYQAIMQIGLAYSFGILFAIGVCGATSGGHFNPCITISFVVFKGFPPLKAVRYIFAQILGAYLACLVIYTEWRELLVQCEAILEQAGKLEALQFTPNGPAGIFGLYLPPGQTLPRVFLNEFVTDTLIGLILFAAVDPTNALVPPVMGSVLVALAYAVAIWGFATPGNQADAPVNDHRDIVALNSARDIGGRMLALTMWGREAAGGQYAAIAALTNIPATLFGAFLYEVFLTDSDRVVPPVSLEYGNTLANHRRLRKTAQKAHRQSRQSIIEFHSTMELQPPVAKHKPNEVQYAP
ncbi:hypothetical protein C0995_008976 [Termitomyces sp. Mi166|nr:hypothetical protein C0995_008976 [Termitomyces sp. Mi166\